jgi:acetylornithine/N-succinyldiaminopimelate aminotransferase
MTLPGIRTDKHLLPIAGRAPLTITSGQGSFVFDAEGRRYLDAITGIGVNALGHAHPRISAALLDQAQLSIHTSNLFHHPYQSALAERLCAMSGMDRAFLSSSGTEAVEAALKAVRAHGGGGNHKTELVALHNSFHGRTLGSLAVTGQPKYRQPFEPLSPPVTFVEPNDRCGLDRAVNQNTAGIILEPVVGEGGIFPLEPDFLRLARELATRSGALLVADEIQCGLGRTGRHFAYQESGIQPDIVVVAKPLGGGLPLGATLFTEKAAAALPLGSHGTTFGGGPLACRVALEFLSVLDGLLPNIRERGEQLLEGLRALRERRPMIREVRGKGLMIGIQLDRGGAPFVEQARARGLLINCTHDTVLRLLPPFTLTGVEAAQIIQGIDSSLSDQAILKGYGNDARGNNEGRPRTSVRRPGGSAL